MNLLAGILIGMLLALLIIIGLFMFTFQVGPWKRMAAVDETPSLPPLVPPTRKPRLRRIK